MSRGKQKKLAVINDMTCFGRCALTVSIPIISAMKVQCCPLPTALFSNHTAYPSFFKQDCTEQMGQMMQEWKKLGLKFDGILVGYLGSEEQIELVQQFIREFSTPETIVIVDPVMGDNGQRYPSYTEEMSQRMRELVAEADIITPNLTECCILTENDVRLRDSGLSERKFLSGSKGLSSNSYLERLAAGKGLEREEILEMGELLLGQMKGAEGQTEGEAKEEVKEEAKGKNKIEAAGDLKKGSRGGKRKQVVISGISGEKTLTNLCLTEGEKPHWLKNQKVGTERCGTGDVFAAILAAGSVRGIALEEAIRKATHFIELCIRRSEELEIPVTDGICLEEFLTELLI